MTGAIDAKTEFAEGDFRKKVPRMTSEARTANWSFVELLKLFGERRGATPAQIALAWLLAQRPWIVPIPGTTKFSRMEENIGAAALKLDEGELRELSEAASALTVQGERYPAENARLSGR